jgi:peptidoglycan/LPS O-acetylase OafA/YrhL
MKSRPLIAVSNHSQIPHLTGLRGLAAVMVLAAHLIAIFPRDFVYLTNFSLTLAYTGICAFFVLSGFVITYNYADRFGQQGNNCWASYEFLVARFARLYPLYLFVCLLPKWGRCDGVVCVTSYLTMTQSWLGLQSTIPPIELTWSISTEWFFYMAFLLFVPLLNRIGKASTVWIIFGCSIFGAILAQWVIYEHQSPLANLMSDFIKSVKVVVI